MPEQTSHCTDCTFVGSRAALESHLLEARHWELNPVLWPELDPLKRVALVLIARQVGEMAREGSVARQLAERATRTYEGGNDLAGARLALQVIAGALGMEVSRVTQRGPH